MLVLRMMSKSDETPQVCTEEFLCAFLRKLRKTEVAYDGIRQ